MGLRIRISPQTLDLLEELLERPSEWRHGYALSQSTEISSGTLSPTLMRLENLRWLETKWEEPKGSRPPRHLYRLTSQARAWAREELGNACARKVWKPSPSEA